MTLDPPRLRLLPHLRLKLIKPEKSGEASGSYIFIDSQAVVVNLLIGRVEVEYD
jgi:hypothetical protein